MVGIQTLDFDVHIKPQTDRFGKITSGVVIGDILAQNQAVILTMNKGELKERPELGVGINDMLLDHDPLYWRTIIREALELDGQKVKEVKITSSNIYIDSTY